MKYYDIVVAIASPYNTYTYIVAAPNEETAWFLVEEEVYRGHNIPNPDFISSREINYTPSAVGVILEVYTGE